MPAPGLPSGWLAVRLGDVAAPRGEAVEPSVAPEQNYIGLEHLESGRTRIGQWGSSSEVKSLKNKFTAGDIPYGKLRPYLDKAALVEWPGLCSTDIIVIVPSEAVDPVYLTHLIHTRPFIEWAVSRSRGINLPRTTWKDLQEITIPLPPVAEQRRIVSVVEAVLARVNAARARLARVREVLKRYRAAVLNAAVEGRLTEDWRATHPDVEPADVLLGRILDERRRRWEEAERERYVKTGKTPPLDWRSRYKEPAPPDTGELPELPDGWCWRVPSNFAASSLRAQRREQTSSQRDSGMCLTSRFRI
jgi:type I restriction enzyme S subunit